jgi:hypothetical protein
MRRPGLTDRPGGGGFTGILSSDVAYSLCQWAFVVVLAKLVSAEAAGVYGPGLAISTPLLAFANVQDRNPVASDISDTYTFGNYFGFRIFLLSLAMYA